MADVPAGAHVGLDVREAARTFGSDTVALASALVLYLGLTAIVLSLSLARTGGEFVYAQDDPYIHLAMARTLAEHGVWGVRPYEFASASSSPLWTVILAALWKLGARHVWVPFALNLLFGSALLAVLVRLLPAWRREGHFPAQAAVTGLALAAVVLITPMPTLAVIGMEHTLQVLLVVLFVSQSATRLAGERDDWAVPCLVAALMVATRYESLFLVAVVGLGLAGQQRWRAALLLGVASATPVIAFGVYSVAHGGLMLPNSLLMKSGPARFASVGSGISAVLLDWLSIGMLFERPAQLALTLSVLTALLLVPADRLVRRSPAVWIGVVFLGASGLHACLVKIDWFYRYDAYLMTLGLLALVAIAPEVEFPEGRSRKRGPRWHPAMLPLLVLLAVPLVLRGLSAAATTTTAMVNVFEQQVQLGRFFARYYPDRVVAINDLGAVSWLSSSRILDIVGLASQPVADLKRRRALDAAALAKLASERGVEVIALYEDIFARIIPAEWQKVGEWTTRNNVALAGDTVAFFAPDAATASRLRDALSGYRAELPPGVRWAEDSRRLPPGR